MLFLQLLTLPEDLFPLSFPILSLRSKPPEVFRSSVNNHNSGTDDWYFARSCADFPMKWLLLLIKSLSEDNLQFVGLFRVQSREHAETMLPKMGTSAPDVDGTSVFQLEGEQQRIAFLSSGWLIVSDDPSFSHLVLQCSSGKYAFFGKKREFTSPHFSASGDTLLRGFVTKDLLLPLFPKAFLLNLNTSFRHVSLFVPGYSIKTEYFWHISIFLSLECRTPFRTLPKIISSLSQETGQ